MRHRGVLVAILASAVATSIALAGDPSFSRSAAVRYSPSFLWPVLLIFAVAGSRIAWALSFVGGVLIAGLLGAGALTQAENNGRWALAGVAAIVVLALWGLKPEDTQTSGPPNQG